MTTATQYPETVQLIALRMVREEPGEAFGSGAQWSGAIRTPADVDALLGPYMRGLPQEELWVIPVDIKNRPLGMQMLYRGSLNSAPLRAAEVFRVALMTNAAALVLVHNHPSGDVTPSPSDMTTTANLVAAGKLLEMPILDHVIIGDPSWYSMRENGAGGL